MISTNTPPKYNRKFKERDFFHSPSPEYFLLPFKFHRLNEYQEVMVNEVGDFLVVPRGTVHRIVQREVNPQSEEELYGDLLSHYMISEEPVTPLLDVLATRYRTKKSFLDGFTSLHIFVITLRCEHTCHYCQVSRVTQDRQAYDMSEARIDRGIDLMMKSPNPHLTMEFQGGEPLLAFDRIVYAVEQAKAKAVDHEKRINFVICTNLALISEEILQYCQSNHILLSVSLDGPESLHNSNRKRPGNNSYELTIRGLELARQFLGEDRVSALMTTTSLSLQYPKEIVEEYVRRGFHHIFLRPISPYGFAVRNQKRNAYQTEEFLTFYKTALQRIIEHNLNGYHLIEDYAAILLKKILTPFPVGYVDLQSPAGLINNVIVFNYDGKVFASDEARMLAEMKDDTFCLGSLDTHSYQEIFYGEKARWIAQVWTNEGLAGCSECAFQAYCGADPVFHHATQGDAYGYRPTSGFCRKNMELIRYLIELMNTTPEINRVFRRWISQS